MRFLWHKNFYFFPSIAKKYNLINIVAVKRPKSLPKFFEIFSTFLTNETFGGALAPPAPPDPKLSILQKVNRVWDSRVVSERRISSHLGAW